jgi:CBS-domain-containing membrane protein
MTVERICQRDVDTAEADTSAFLAAERMRQRSVGALAIVDDARVPIDIVTDRVLVIRVIAAGHRRPRFPPPKRDNADAILSSPETLAR